MPGGSPMGLRLPLGQLPWAIEEFFEYDYIPPSVQEPQGGSSVVVESAAPPAADAKPETVRAYFKQFVEVPYTALCIEPRLGHLYVFMPRLENFDHYAALAHGGRGHGVRTGHAGADRRLRTTFGAAIGFAESHSRPGCDRGEHSPAPTTGTISNKTPSTLYEQARLSRLGTEKFMLDGRHTGTGGGNHVTLGADQPE